MAETNNGLAMYGRLQLAYAAEFAIWGAWSYKLGGWGDANNVAVGSLYSAFALGALFSPVVGPIADRKFAAQKVFAFLHLVCGAALLLCGAIASGMMGDPSVSKLWGPMFVAGIAFMPSIPLLNAIVFKNVPNKEKAPWIFIFGTIGWILVNYAVTVSNFFFIGGGVAIALALYALTLPNTPPAGSTNNDPFGLKALALFKRKDFAICMLCAFMVGIFGSNYYFGLVDGCFPGKGVYNQYSEILFMAALTFAVPRFGLKWTLTVGMAAWGVRYLCFAQGSDSLALVGLLCHGMAYTFLYTAAYMYADKVASDEMKANVQALVAFLLLGVGQVLSGVAMDALKGNASLEKADAAPATEEVEKTASQNLFGAYAFAQDASLDAAVPVETAEPADAAVPVEIVEPTAAAPAETAEPTAAAPAETDEPTAAAPAETAEPTAAAPAETDEATEAEGKKEEAKGFRVWDPEMKAKYNWNIVWGIPGVFCLFWAIVFALLGKEPKAAEEEAAASEAA